MEFSGRNEGMQDNEEGSSNCSSMKEHNSSYIYEAMAGALKTYENHLRKTGENPPHIRKRSWLVWQ